MPHARQATLLDRPTLFSHGAAALHAATGAPVWFAVLLLEPDQHAPEGFALRLHTARLAARRAPGSANDVGVPPTCATALMQAYADALTDAVRRAPSQYFWWHRRWRVVGPCGSRVDGSLRRTPK